MAPEGFNISKLYIKLKTIILTMTNPNASLLYDNKAGNKMEITYGLFIGRTVKISNTRL